MTAEHARLAEATGRAEDDLFSANPWYEWGPYLSERAWGTVREDYSESGDAWSSFPHDHARSRAYRWNEDGMAGLSDIRHELCLALALWNGNDPILKERMFGLTGPQGNHGEDVKEYWWYLEGLPSHALLRWRYHYPQAAFPYEQLVDHGRGLQDPELELLDTGVFDDDRYWSVDVTYAKASPTEVLMRIELENHGPDEATLHVLPSLWFRNIWSYGDDGSRPRIEGDGPALTVADHRLAGYRLDGAPGPDGSLPEALLCENESNAPRVFGAAATTPYPKDGINDHVVSGAATVNPDGVGTKGALWYRVTVAAGGKAELRLRLRQTDDGSDWAGDAFADVVAAREQDADEFYTAIAPDDTPPEQLRILRQACAGLVWSKQIYPYNVARWLDGDPGSPTPPEAHRHGRNSDWRHLDSFDVLAMPDPWEYPWFAAWDLGFHAIPWAHLDPAFAKYQLVVLLREWFQHPNGALPAYEWNFDDVNPPVHVMAALRVYAIDGGNDREFLERIFQKLLINFTWWLNREDPDGNNVFGGGFLGLDNISPIDRSNLPAGLRLEQADGTAWMAYYALSMLFIALKLVEENEIYWDMVIKFLEQFVLVARSLDEQGLYDADDGFFYDRLVYPSGESTAVKVKTISGLIPVLPAVPLSARVVGAAEKLGKRFSRLRDAWAESAGPSRTGRAHSRAERGRSAPLGDRPRRPPQDARRVLRRGGVPLAARASRRLEAVPGQPVQPRRRPGRVDRLRAGGIDDVDVRRQLELARAGLDAAQLPRDPSVRDLPGVLRRRLQARVPDRLGHRALVRRDRAGPRRPARLDLAAGAGRASAALRRNGAAPDGSRVERQPLLQRVLPRRQRSGPGRRASDRLDRSCRRPDPRPPEQRPDPGPDGAAGLSFSQDDS